MRGLNSILFLFLFAAIGYIAVIIFLVLSMSCAVQVIQPTPDDNEIGIILPATPQLPLPHTPTIIEPEDPEE